MRETSKCPGGVCPFKENCFRYTKQPSQFQFHFKHPPYDWLNGTCHAFIPKGEVKPEDMPKKRLGRGKKNVHSKT